MSGYAHARLDLDAERFRQSFDREPMGFSHNLSELDLFKIDSLHALAEKMVDRPHDYFIVESAPSPEAPFFSVPMVALKPAPAIEDLQNRACRILLKRAEDHDARFRDLIHTLFEQVLQTIGGLRGQKVVRLESGILISSAATITPFHYDPEIGCFSQIEGEKMYHVYPPAVVSDTQLERSCLSSPVNLSPLELGSVDATREYVFRLTAGKGFHQPQNSPHWVETGNSRSISYTFVFETDATRAVARTRALTTTYASSGCAPRFRVRALPRMPSNRTRCRWSFPSGDKSAA